MKITSKIKLIDNLKISKIDSKIKGNCSKWKSKDIKMQSKSKIDKSKN
jgi:hypothetical protein